MTEELTKKVRVSGKSTYQSIVNHVSITLNQGDIYGLIGAGGAGKTTFMRLVCGLVKPTEGTVSLFGETGKRLLRKARRRVGAMVGGPAFYGDLTALENLTVQGRYFRHPLSGEEMRKLLEQVGLENAGKQCARRFSRGMKRQLGVALALVGRPELVILDEPYLEVEDEKTELLRRFLLRLNREQGLTILFGSATKERFPGLATRYGFLHEGRLVREFSEEI